MPVLFIYLLTSYHTTQFQIQGTENEEHNITVSKVIAFIIRPNRVHFTRMEALPHMSTALTQDD